jgi:AcrR family transcriptional regulator
MRARLLTATAATLFDRGYSRTTTTEIARRARVSRGAQLHHFPTKAELVVTGLRHLFVERTNEFRAAFAALSQTADRVAVAVDLLWGILSGPTFYAWLELIVAARTDAKLRRAVAPLGRQFIDMVQDTFRVIFPDASVPIAPHFAFAVMQGLAIDAIAVPDAAHIPEILERIRALGRLVLPQKEMP